MIACDIVTVEQTKLPELSRNSLNNFFRFLLVYFRNGYCIMSVECDKSCVCGQYKSSKVDASEIMHDHRLTNAWLTECAKLNNFFFVMRKKKLVLSTEGGH